MAENVGRQARTFRMNSGLEMAAAFVDAQREKLEEILERGGDWLSVDEAFALGYARFIVNRQAEKIREGKTELVDGHPTES